MGKWTAAVSLTSSGPRTKSVYDNFDEYQSLSVDNQRSKRSLIPLIGQLMSTLFGTVSDNEQDNINRKIKALARNREQIIHDLDVSLSVLNLTRMQVIENRRSFMDLIIVVNKSWIENFQSSTWLFTKVCKA